MKRLLYTPLIVMLILSVLSVTGGAPYTPPSPGTWIHVEPDPSYRYSDVEDLTGTHFNVSVNVFNVTSLVGWEWKLWYNTTLLNGVRVYQTWLTENNTQWVPSDYGEFDPTRGINDTLGRVFYSAVIPITTPFTGSGPLLTINFTATAVGGCGLHFNETVLVGCSGPPDFDMWDISHEIVDGSVIVIPEFPASIITPLLLITTLAAAFLGKMFWSRKRKDALITE